MNAMTGKHDRIDESQCRWSTIDDAPRFPGAHGPSSLLRRLAVWLRECRQRGRERAHLQMLSDHMLRDIGVTAAEAGAEASKWPWMK